MKKHSLKSTLRNVFLLALVILLVASCRQEPASTDTENLEIEISVDEESMQIGDSELVITIRDEAGNSIQDASIQVRGDMTHAGMVPVIREVESANEEGQYIVPFEWTMGGDWFVEVTVTLADGETVSDRFEYTIPTGDDSTEMAEMDHEDMAGGTSALYMVIRNESVVDDALVDVETDVANVTELHETQIDENDVARMAPTVEIGVPAGGTVELVPGGFHVMLMGLQNDLIAGETVVMTLIFGTGIEIEIEALVQDVPPEGFDSVAVDDLVISNAWVRPATVMAMDETEGMEMSEDGEAENMEGMEGMDDADDEDGMEMNEDGEAENMEGMEGMDDTDDEDGMENMEETDETSEEDTGN